MIWYKTYIPVIGVDDEAGGEVFDAEKERIATELADGGGET